MVLAKYSPKVGQFPIYGNQEPACGLEVNFVRQTNRISIEWNDFQRQVSLLLFILIGGPYILHEIS